ncbi:hypothetical protein GCM10014715_00010 [Streptomyces spiralis]|uniref:Uncharacterized protein n=1 Tax=Streptomyces spiralis TaxID=66376 RepID=A0A918ZG88_9ACTN|nr:hypothetical protein GCM10014715_00010 [Streptomyces spiralis]
MPGSALTVPVGSPGSSAVAVLSGPAGGTGRGRVHHLGRVDFVGFPSFMLSPQVPAARLVGGGRASSTAAP